MKRIIIYVVLIITLISLGIIGYMNKPLERPNEKILGVTYYRYNPETNNYDEFMIDNKEISYTGTDYDFNNCKEYTYDPNTGIIKLDCNQSFRVGGETENSLIIEQDNIRTQFYSSKESSYNYEFQNYFKTTESMYKSSGENALKEKEIDIEKLSDLIKENETSFVYIKSDTCTTSCTIFNHTYQSFSKTDNTYYLNLSKLTQSDIDDLHEEFETFPSSLRELTKSYPQVLVIGNKELSEIIKIEINGFDASKYENYVEKYGEDNNENNE